MNNYELIAAGASGNGEKTVRSRFLPPFEAVMK
jgi:hypothetical protein